MKNYRDILFGILGGVTTVVLLLATNQINLLSWFLSLLIPFPVYMATLGWGARAGITAVVIAFAAVMSLSSATDALTFTAPFTVIAVMLGYQANLAQPNPEQPDTLIWYPASRLLFNLAVATIIAVALAFVMNNVTPDALEKFFNELLRRMAKLNPSIFALTDKEIALWAKSYARTMPFVVPTALIFIHLINLGLASAIGRRSGLFNRPQSDLAASLTLPAISIPIAAIGLLGMALTEGLVGQISTLVAGAFVTVLAIVGLASAHFNLRNNPIGPLIVFLMYFIFLLFLLPFYFLAISGILRVARPPHPPIPPNQNDTPNNDGQ